MDDTLNELIRDYEIETDWAFQQKAELAYTWYARFNAALFEGALPPPFIQFKKVHRTRIGGYKQGRNPIGARHEITLNTLYLREDQPLFVMLGALLHTMIHTWEEVQGRASGTNYHPRTFVDKARALGIPCHRDYRCAIAKYTDPFVSLLAEYGVVVDPLWQPPARKESYLKRWACGCPCQTVVWSHRPDIFVLCGNCGERLEQVKKT